MPEFINENEKKSQSIQDAMTVGDESLAPEEVAQLDAYSDNATNIIYNSKTQPAILQELQSDPVPVKAIGMTANHIHQILLEGLEREGESMNDRTMFLGGAHIVSELIMLGETAGLFQLSQDERMDALQMTIQIYFEKGLKDGSIDPVELQKEIEPLMTKEQREFGLRAMESQGISKTAPPSGGIGGRSLGAAEMPASSQQGGIVSAGSQAAPPQQGAGLVAQGGMGNGQ
jgi:hypothetical protein